MAQKRERGERSRRRRIRKTTQKEAETEKENETEREDGRKNAREGKMEAKLTQQQGKNGKGPDALDWFLHGQSLAGGDGEARSLL